LNDDVWYRLRDLVWSKRFDDAHKILLFIPEIVDHRNGIGETVLHYLAVEDDAEGVEWLYENGFSADVSNKFGEHVIFEVAQLEYKNLFRWFISVGVKFDRYDMFEYLKEYGKQDMIDFIMEEFPN
jgi:hypothetical protein